MILSVSILQEPLRFVLAARTGTLFLVKLVVLRISLIWFSFFHLSFFFKQIEYVQQLILTKTQTIKGVMNMNDLHYKSMHYMLLVVQVELLFSLYQRNLRKQKQTHDMIPLSWVFIIILDNQQDMWIVGVDAVLW